MIMIQKFERGIMNKICILTILAILFTSGFVNALPEKNDEIDQTEIGIIEVPITEVPSSQYYTGCLTNISRWNLPKGVLYYVRVGTTPAGVCESGDITITFVKKDYINSLEARIAKLEKLLTNVTRSGNDIYFNRANVHIRSGSGKTDGKVNGLGNLIVGYNEPRIGDINIRSGSHNLIIGSRNNYKSFGGLIGGDYNEISGTYASVSGGIFNKANGQYSSISGGHGNTASGYSSSICGGQGNTASGDSSSVSGGATNFASGLFSWAGGGLGNEANGSYSTVSGGSENIATGGTTLDATSVFGGVVNKASGIYSTVSGGESNLANGVSSSVSGGSRNLASGGISSILGGEINIARGEYSTVSGGSRNVARGLSSSVSGGFNRSVNSQFDWKAGRLFQDS
jgi:hypothetical protein